MISFNIESKKGIFWFHCRPHPPLQQHTTTKPSYHGALSNSATVDGSYAAHALSPPTYGDSIESASPGEYDDGGDWRNTPVKALKIASAATVHNLLLLQMMHR